MPHLTYQGAHGLKSVLSLGILALGFGIFLYVALPVLLCLVARGRQNCNHSVTPLLQPGADH